MSDVLDEAREWLAEELCESLTRAESGEVGEGYSEAFWAACFRETQQALYTLGLEARPVGEDPHGWVSVDDRMPEVGALCEVWLPMAGREGERWFVRFRPLGDSQGRKWFTEPFSASVVVSICIFGVTHWRIPTPGPSSTGGE